MDEIVLPPEPDCVEGAPHPRNTHHLFGHARAEAEVLTAFTSDRFHHGWLITGPQGIGKATLAWRMARFLLATPPAQDDGLFGAPPPPQTLDIDPEHPVARRVRALSDPGLFVLRRGGAGTTENDRQKNLEAGKFSAVIRVDEIRKLGNFFHMSAADGGRRVVIVDAADDLNPSAANALLKMLEEPPAGATLLLISHQPARLLPTIKSRCRTLRLSPLGTDDMQAALAQADVALTPEDIPALARLAEGSVGQAIRLHHLDGMTLYRDLLGLLGSMPALDRPRLLGLAESCAGKNKEERLPLLLDLSARITARLARTGVTGQPPDNILPKEAEILTRLAPDPRAGRAWAEAMQTASDRARHALAVNIDPAQLVTDHILQLQKALQG